MNKTHSLLLFASHWRLQTWPWQTQHCDGIKFWPSVSLLSHTWPSPRGRTMRTSSPCWCPRCTRPSLRRTSAPRFDSTMPRPITSSGSSPTRQCTRLITCWSTAARSPDLTQTSSTAAKWPSKSQVRSQIHFFVTEEEIWTVILT